jgi:purine-binding chemotaxis protein CheW
MSDERHRARGKIALPESGTAEEILALLGKKLPRSSEQILEFADLTAQLSHEESAPAVEMVTLLLFDLSRETYGIPVTRVLEILRVGEITRVPGAPPHVRGIINVRGRILPAVELRTRITLGELAITEAARLVVVEASGRTLGILVDRVRDIVHVARHDFGAPPRELSAEATDYVSAVGKVAERLVLLVDLERALRLPKSQVVELERGREGNEGQP